MAVGPGAFRQPAVRISLIVLVGPSFTEDPTRVAGGKPFPSFQTGPWKLEVQGGQGKRREEKNLKYPIREKMVKQRNKHGFNGGETFSNLKNGKILWFQNGCRTAAGNCCIFHSTNHLKNCCMFQKLEISGLSWEFWIL